MNVTKASGLPCMDASATDWAAINPGSNAATEKRRSWPPCASKPRIGDLQLSTFGYAGTLGWLAIDLKRQPLAFAALERLSQPITLPSLARLKIAPE